MQLPHEISDLISFFLTEYPTSSPPEMLEDVVKRQLQSLYREERATELAESFTEKIQDVLVIEFNERHGEKRALRFRLISSDGSKIAGAGNLIESERLEFQDAINNLSPSLFEGISALVLRAAGCNYLRRTPESHDQGIDAFGYMEFFKAYPLARKHETCRLTFLAQAKHYRRIKVGSKDIREFIGSATLAVHRIFSSVDIKYEDLEILPFSPVALVFVTSEEVPGTVRRLAQRTGIIVVTSDDLFDTFVGSLPTKPTQITSEWLKAEWVRDIAEIPVAH